VAKWRKRIEKNTQERKTQYRVQKQKTRTGWPTEKKFRQSLREREINGNDMSTFQQDFKKLNYYKTEGARTLAFWERSCLKATWQKRVCGGSENTPRFRSIAECSAEANHQTCSIRQRFSVGGIFK